MITITEEMFSTGQPLAQGEVLIWMRKYAPAAILARAAALRFEPAEVHEDYFILGHSETGHHHVLEAAASVPFSEAAQVLIDAANDTLVELRLAQPCALIHRREHDTHEALLLPPGEYIRGIREEQTPEGWRQVQD